MSGRICIEDATANDIQALEAMKERGGNIGILPSPQDGGLKVAAELAQRITSALSGRIVVLERLS